MVSRRLYDEDNNSYPVEESRQVPYGISEKYIGRHTSTYCVKETMFMRLFKNERDNKLFNRIKNLLL